MNLHHDIITLYVDHFGLGFHGSYYMDSSQAHMRSPSSSSSPPSLPSSSLNRHHHLDDQVHIGWVSRKIASLQLLCRSLGNLFLGKKKHFGEVTFEEITFRDFQMPQRQRPERFFVSKFRTNSIEHLKSNPSHTQTKAISHSPTLNNIDVWKRKFHALSNFIYGPIPRVKSECKTLKNLKSSARLRDSYQCNFFFIFNLDLFAGSKSTKRSVPKNRWATMSSSSSSLPSSAS